MRPDFQPVRRAANVTAGLALVALLALVPLGRGSAGWDESDGRSAGASAPVLRRPAAPAVESGATVLRVGAGEAFTSVGAALEAADPGDTIRVGPGVYRERLRVEEAVVLLGEGRPVLDGGGAGHVVEATAPLELHGFAVRGSGTSVDEEHAGVMVRGARAVVVDNHLEDVLYGVYLKQAPGSVVRGNRIRGKPLAPPRRGDGIRLWYSSGTRVEDNVVDRTRDVVVYFSNRLSVRGNRISNGRYGLHYMYSDDNEFEANVFTDNQVGAFVMYSRDVRLRDNVFAESEGASGMGLGLKDADDVVAEGNLFVANGSGAYLDNSPRARDAVVELLSNLFLYNGAALRLMPSVRDVRIEANSFVGNDRPAEVSGGIAEGQVAQNDWTGNYWSGYAGFDRDEDGVGDTPYVHARLTEDLLSRHPSLRLFAHSPVMPVVETLRRVFPLLEPEPVVVDSAPLLRAAALRRWERSPPVGPGRAAELRAGGRLGAAPPETTPEDGR